MRFSVVGISLPPLPPPPPPSLSLPGAPSAPSKAEGLYRTTCRHRTGAKLTGVTRPRFAEIRTTSHTHWLPTRAQKQPDQKTNACLKPKNSRLERQTHELPCTSSGLDETHDEETAVKSVLPWRRIRLNGGETR